MSQTTLTIDCDAAGTPYTTTITNALLAIDSMHSGPTAPTAEQNLHDGKLWLDTSNADNKYKILIGNTWYILADFNGSKWYFEQAKVATTLETARDIQLTGKVTGTATFNGEADAVIATTLDTSGTWSGNATTATTAATLTGDSSRRYFE